MLFIATGFRRAMAASGAADAAIVLRSGADSAMVSGLSREETRLIADASGVAPNTRGPLASAELLEIINLPKRATGTDAKVPLRRIDGPAMDVRDNMKIIEGRLFAPGKNEVVVGRGAAREFAGLALGSTVKVGRAAWPVVGFFSAGAGFAASEIGSDATVPQGAYQRGDSFQSVSARLHSPSAFTEFKAFLTSNPRLSVKVERPSVYYAGQSETLTRLITTLGVLVAGLMAVGAVFGALNARCSAVAARTREIATLRALAGGALGAGLAYLAFDNFRAATMNAATMNCQSFSQVTFAFAVTPQLLVQGIIWAAVIGLIGRLPTALRAARLPIAAALHEL